MKTAEAGRIAVASTGKGIRMISAVHVGAIPAEDFPVLPVIPWMKRGACKGTKDPDKFFRERSDRKGPKESRAKVKGKLQENTEDAKKICAVCPVSADCLLWALTHDEEYGIWGGSTPDERRVMRRYM